MRSMMEGVVLSEPDPGRLDGYSSGGKTGSAQIFDQARTAIRIPTMVLRGFAR